jgi:hypothetical protein
MDGVVDHPSRGSGAALVPPSTLKRERAMGSINTEEAARRLARVILSDIELYNRERPRQGETLEAQIEEGRRLFKSRVTPDLLPVFALVLADRAVGSVKSPAVAEPPSIRAGAAATSGPDQASPASNPGIEDRSTPAPSIAAEPVEDERTPAAAFAAPPAVDQPGLIATVPAAPLAGARAAATSSPDHESPVANLAIEDRPTPAPSIAAEPLEDERTPAPVFSAPPVLDQRGFIAHVPATRPANEAPALAAQARPIAARAYEIPVPVLTARISIPRLFVVAAAVAATGAVLYHFIP